MVFDGVMPHVAGGRRGEFNLRLGQPSLNIHASVASLPPFNDEGVFARLRQRGRVPRILATNSAAEYWRGDASLIHTDIEGRAATPSRRTSCARICLRERSTRRARCRRCRPIRTPAAAAIIASTLSDYAPLLRSALVNLDRWVSEGVEPPPSAFPRIADGTAVEAESLGAFFRTLPGVRFPDRVERPPRLDFGPDIDRGIAAYPPKAGAAYRSYVSAVDADGNEVAGIRSAGARGAARDIHRLEPAPSRAGRAGRPHVDDGLDAAVPAHASCPRAHR